MIPMVLSLLLVGEVEAAACNAKALQKAVEEATPRSVAGPFVALAACDPELAKQAAPAVFSRMIPGEDFHRAVTSALSLGLGGLVRIWVGELMADERAMVFSWMGKHCTESPEILPFLTESRDVLGDRFWADRWPRAVIGCQEPAAFDLIATPLQSPEVLRQPTRVAAALEVLSSNWKQKSLPTLKAVVLATEGESQLHALRAFLDASGAGSMEGPDPEATAAAVAALLEVAPQLPKDLLPRAREVLVSLGDTNAADRLVAVRYAEQAWPGGGLAWGVFAVEKVTCKNGKRRLGVHVARAHDVKGHIWPEALPEVVEAAVRSSWELAMAEKCGGTMDLEIQISPEPFASEAVFQAWKEAGVADWKRRVADRIEVFEEETIRLP